MNGKRVVLCSFCRSCTICMEFIYCMYTIHIHTDSMYDFIFISMNHVYLTRRLVFHKFVCVVYRFFFLYSLKYVLSFSWFSGFVHGFPICFVLVRLHLPVFHALITLNLYSGSKVFFLKNTIYMFESHFPFQKDHFVIYGVHGIKSWIKTHKSFISGVYQRVFKKI